jgi:hypothetical protein
VGDYPARPLIWNRGFPNFRHLAVCGEDVVQYLNYLVVARSLTIRRLHGGEPGAYCGGAWSATTR